MGTETSETGRQGQKSETRGKQGQMEEGQRWDGNRMEVNWRRDQSCNREGVEWDRVIGDPLAI